MARITQMQDEELQFGKFDAVMKDKGFTQKIQKTWVDTWVLLSERLGDRLEYPIIGEVVDGGQVVLREVGQWRLD